MTPPKETAPATAVREAIRVINISGTVSTAGEQMPIPELLSSLEALADSLSAPAPRLEELLDEYRTAIERAAGGSNHGNDGPTCPACIGVRAARAAVIAYINATAQRIWTQAKAAVQAAATPEEAATTPSDWQKDIETLRQLETDYPFDAKGRWAGDFASRLENAPRASASREEPDAELEKLLVDYEAAMLNYSGEEGRRRIAEQIRALFAASRSSSPQEETTSGTDDWPQRFACYAFSTTAGFSRLSEDDQQTCRDAAEWARQRVAEAVAPREAPRFTHEDVQMLRYVSRCRSGSDDELQATTNDLASRIAASLPDKAREETALTAKEPKC